MGKAKSFFFCELLYGKLADGETRCKGRSGYRKLVEFDEFVGKKGSRPGANITHGGEWRGGLSSHHANKRAPGVGLRERRGEELSGGT